MPLLDHFHPPLSERRHWEALHSAWANELCRQLNEGLPPRYFAEAHIHLGGRVEVDVGTFEEEWGGAGRESEGGVAVWAPSRPTRVVPASFDHPDVFEVQIFADEGGPRLVAAIELISPANKDRPGQRHMFAVKCASYLYQGVGLVLVDVVTERSTDLHGKLLSVLDVPAGSETGNLFAAAYRTVPADGSIHLEYWFENLSLASPLPKLPLWIGQDRCLPLDLEHAYTASCRMLRIL